MLEFRRCSNIGNISGYIGQLPGNNTDMVIFFLCHSRNASFRMADSEMKIMMNLAMFAKMSDASENVSMA